MEVLICLMGKSSVNGPWLPVRYVKSPEVNPISFRYSPLLTHCLNHEKSPWITMKPPLNHHEITIKSYTSPDFKKLPTGMGSFIMFPIPQSIDRCQGRQTSCWTHYDGVTLMVWYLLDIGYNMVSVGDIGYLDIYWIWYRIDRKSVV